MRRDLRPLIPAATVLAGWLVWVGLSGGYAAETWYPSALVALSLWVVVITAGGRVLPAHTAARAALLVFLAIVVLNYLSILWAASPGDALQASNELALYLLVAWIFAVLPWTPRALAVLMGLWSTGIAAFCAVQLIRAADASSLTAFFVEGRFATPMEYSNATAALAVMGMWPTLILSARRELPAWLRAICLGIAVFLAGFSTLPQSRAALLGLILTAPLALIAGSGRVRLLARMVIVGSALAVCLPRTVGVDNAVNAGRDVTPVLSHAAAGMLITSLGAVVAGFIVAWIENRLGGRLPRRAGPGAQALLRRPYGRSAALGLAAGAAVVVAVAGVLLAPQIVNKIHTVIRQGNTDAGTGSTRLLSASPEERVDYARVALHLFSGSPVLGIGAGNFGRRYDALRRFVKHSQYTHNLPLRVLSETGLVGATLFVALLAALLLGTARASRGRDDLGRACAAIALCVAGYFIVHSCFDWVDEFPALAAPALALPIAAAGLPGAQPPPGTRRRASRRVPWRHPRVCRSVAGGIGVAGAAFLVAALATSYVSLRLVDRAFAIGRISPNQVYHDLSVARSLDPLSVDPLTSEGTLALYLGATGRSKRAFERSVKQEDDWYPRLELALIDAQQGQFAPALHQLDAVARLDANDPLVGEARQLVLHHQRINPISFNRQVLQEGNSTASSQQPIR